MIFPEALKGAAQREAEVVKTSGMLGWRRLQAKVYRFSPGGYAWSATPSHRLFMHIGGRARIGLRGGGRVEAREAKAGLVWLSPAGRQNAGLEVLDDAAEMLLLLAPAEFAADLSPSEYGLARQNFAFVEREGISDPVIEAIARSLLAELDTPDPAGALYADSVASTLTAYLLRSYATRILVSPALSEMAEKPVDLRFERVIAYVDANLGSELSLEILAREAGLSLFHFARSFKAATGMAPHRFVLNCRIARARALLDDKDMPLAAVAKVCGFASQAHMTHVFRRATQSTPGAYRAGVVKPTDSG